MILHGRSISDRFRDREYHRNPISCHRERDSVLTILNGGRAPAGLHQLRTGALHLNSRHEGHEPSPPPNGIGKCQVPFMHHTVILVGSYAPCWYKLSTRISSLQRSITVISWHDALASHPFPWFNHTLCCSLKRVATL